MATTTNYGWTTPDDTALVKDGAAAIRTLGSSIDTSLNTALGTKKAGLVLLNTTSFSGVASQSINDVFSATYNHYLIVSSLFSNNFCFEEPTQRSISPASVTYEVLASFISPSIQMLKSSMMPSISELMMCFS